MKVSSKLIQAMLLTATIGITASCEKIDLQKDLNGKGNATVEQGDGGNIPNTGHHSDPCPACGMG